ncbi:MAG: hypothetical protein Q9224_001735, partial [Gallowayella concinna]
LSSRLRANYPRATSRPTPASGWGIWSKDWSISEQQRPRRQLHLLSTQHSRHQRFSPELWTAQYYQLRKSLALLRATTKDEFNFAWILHKPCSDITASRLVWFHIGGLSRKFAGRWQACSSRFDNRVFCQSGAVLISTDYGAMSPPAHSIDPIPSFEREVISSSTYPARVGGASTASRHGSSLEAQTSTGSYLNYDTNAASAAAFGKRSTQLSVQSSKDILDPDEFYVRRPPHNFFVEGKVFIKLHTEDAGNKSDQSSFGFSTIPYGQRAYSQLRRFVVVKAKPREHYCLCVPITTYSGQGATKKSIDQSAHAIIYTGKSPPDKLPEEQRMNKDPLRVIPDRRDEKLDSRSRINLGKIYTVEWNTKVKEIGHLERNSLVKMIAYWKSVMDI